jgi:hypothetical protein
MPTYHKYFNTVTNQATGRPFSGVDVRVLNSDGSLASIYGDSSGTTQDNPVTTGSSGRYEFYVPAGTYDFEFLYGDEVVDTVTDVTIAVGATDLSDDAGASSVGTTNGDTVQEALDSRARNVADAAAQAALEVVEGQSVIALGVTGGEFAVRDLDEVLAVSTATVRFLPFRPAYNYLVVSAAGTAGDTFTFDGHTVTLVASGAAGQQVNIGADKYQTAKNIRDYVNAAGLGWVCDGGYAIRFRSTTPGPTDNGVAVSENSTALEWSTNGNNPPSVAFTWGSPAADDTITLGDHTITLKASGATGQEINIGADASALATAFAAYITAASLGMTATVGDGYEVILTPTTLEGLVRLRGLAKSCSTITLSARAAAADTLEAIYRVSDANPSLIHVRQIRDGKITPAMWGIEDGDTADVAAQAMLDYNHNNPGTWIEWGAMTIKVEEPLLIRNNYIIAKGGWLINESDTGETTSSCTYPGDGHPGYDDDIATFPITGITAGLTTGTMASGIGHFKVGDVVPVFSTSGDQQLAHLFQRSQRFLREIVDISGTTVTFDTPFPETISPAVIGHFAGVMDATTGKEICVAHGTYIQGLNLESPKGSSMVRGQTYNVDFEFPIMRCTRGIFSNSFCGRARVGLLEFKLKAFELAHSSARCIIEIDNLVYQQGESDVLPIGKYGENSSDFHVWIKNADLTAWDKNVALFNVQPSRRGVQRVDRMEVGNLQSDIVTVDATAVGAHDTQNVTEDISLYFGDVRYGGTPTRLVYFADTAGSAVSNIYLRSGRFEGNAPSLRGCQIAANNCLVDETVSMPGTLRFTASAGKVFGHFKSGLDLSGSTGTIALLDMTSDGYHQVKRRVYYGTATSALVGAKVTADTITVPAAGWVNGDQISIEARYRTTGTAGTKHIPIGINGTTEATLDTPATAAGGVAKFNLVRVSSTSLLIEAHLEGQAVQTSTVETPSNMDSNALVIAIGAYVANAADSINIYQVNTTPMFQGHR